MIHDILIRNGMVIDGTGAQRFAADVAIDGDRITAIGALQDHAGRQEIDATGCIVAPGFIDAHAHDDIALLAEPDMPSKVSQGCTTVVIGNCGFSAAPSPRAQAIRPISCWAMKAITASRASPTISPLLDQSPAAVNAAALVGHSVLRVECMEALDRPANAAETAADGDAPRRGARRWRPRLLDRARISQQQGRRHRRGRLPSPAWPVRPAPSTPPIPATMTPSSAKP